MKPPIERAGGNGKSGDPKAPLVESRVLLKKGLFTTGSPPPERTDVRPLPLRGPARAKQPVVSPVVLRLPGCHPSAAPVSGDTERFGPPGLAERLIGFARSPLVSCPLLSKGGPAGRVPKESLA